MIEYIIPAIIFIVLSGIMYLVSNDPEKNNVGNILLRNVLPGVVVSILVFFILKQSTPVEELMTGGYFD